MVKKEVLIKGNFRNSNWYLGKVLRLFIRRILVLFSTFFEIGYAEDKTINKVFYQAIAQRCGCEAKIRNKGDS